MGLQIAEHIDAPMREQKATPIRVLLFDDHLILRHGKRMMLNVFGDFKRTGYREAIAPLFTITHIVLFAGSNKEIGREVFWSEVQVKRKMQDIYRKFQVTDRAHAVAEAMRCGLI